MIIWMWEIYVDDKQRGLVASSTEQGAIDVWFKIYGSASKYTGVGRDQIKAVRHR